MGSTLFSSSEFQTLLSNNEWSNSDAQIQEIAGERRARLARLVVIEDEMAVLETHLDDLKQEKAELLEDVEQCKTVLHPMRRMPPEILRQIFLLATNWRPPVEKGDSDSEPCPYTNIMPWRLSRTCRRWREICLGFPKIWNNLEFRDGDFGSDRYSYDHERFTTSYLLARHLQNSKQHLLDITINCKTGISSRASILHALLPTSARWRTLSLSITIGSFLALSPIRATIPSLCYLFIQLKRSTYYYAETDTEKIDLFEFAPQLSRLYGDCSVLSTGHFPRMQITEYDEIFNSATGKLDKWIDDFAQMRKLVYCGLILRKDEGNSRSSVKIHLPLLEHLKLTCLDGVHEASVQSFLSRLELTALSMLDIPTYPASIPAKTFGQFSGVQYLLLQPRGTDLKAGEQLVGMLRGLPALENISLGETIRLDEEFLKALLDPDISPKLTEIYVQEDVVPELECFLDRLQDSRGLQLYDATEEEYREWYGCARYGFQVVDNEA